MSGADLFSLPSDPEMHRGGSGSPLVLLHGITGTWHLWQRAVPMLEEQHDVYAATLPGHYGGPEWADETEATLPAIADAVEAQLDEAELETAHLAGNSLGGWLALELARRGRARSVTAFSPAGAWASPRDLRKIVLMFSLSDAFTKRYGTRIEPLMARPGLRKLALGAVAEHGDRLTATEAALALRAAANTPLLARFLKWARTAPPSFERLEGHELPIRIAWSEKDRTIPFERFGRPYLEAIPDAQLVHLPGVGHVPMIDDPALVARSILEVTEKVDNVPTIRQESTR